MGNYTGIIPEDSGIAYAERRTGYLNLHCLEIPGASSSCPSLLIGLRELTKKMGCNKSGIERTARNMTADRIYNLWLEDNPETPETKPPFRIYSLDHGPRIISPSDIFTPRLTIKVLDLSRRIFTDGNLRLVN